MRRPLVIVVGMGLAVVVGRGVQGAGPSCGDVNGDSVINLTDPVCILSFLFLSGPAPECGAGSLSCANVNGDDLVNLSDAVYLLNRLFLGGPDLLCAGGPQEIPGFTFTRMNVQGYPEYMHDQTGIVLVLLSGGKFNMGAQKDDPKAPNHDPNCDTNREGPVHEVTLSPFLIGKYEVTQGQWHAVMGNYPSYFDGTKDENGDPVDPPDDRDSLPVETVSCIDIQNFVASTGLQLPTEAQWEYACRAGTDTACFFGSGESCADWGCAACDERDPFMWYCGNSGGGPKSGRTHEVGTRAANPFGLHDMYGNVWEYCADVFDCAFRPRRPPIPARRRPLIPEQSGHRFRAIAATPGSATLAPFFVTGSVAFHQDDTDREASRF